MPDEFYGQSTESRARRRRAIITVLIVLLLLFFAAWYAMSYIRADTSARATTTSTSGSPTCELTPAQVEVNVYNATDREGLAAQVARGLKERGFVVRTVANDPKQEEVTGRGQLRHGARGTKGAELLSRHVGTVADAPDERERVAVDVVLGPDYRHLVRADQVTDC
ncbi:LytR C-terminal domain-containing protein [Janibacter sp. GS2]|uniref:LytR C-terminal domain-containing protein n=1 Tax=Janibacter sp. GS2 TaxID=3442646 RepID=UPI003EBAB814